MAASDRLRCYAAIHDTGLVPLYYEPDPEVAGRLAVACVDGGARVVELTNRGPGALDAFAAVVQRLTDSDVWVGAGSIMDAPTAAHYIAIGARFIVSPSLDEATARLCNRRKVPYLPGCMTPGEISRAEELGAEIVKVFPGSVGGPEFVSAIGGPMPGSVRGRSWMPPRPRTTSPSEPGSSSARRWTRPPRACATGARCPISPVA
jgi:2-dehydro-3-deoxyphosphogluconate aldolase/(4S)-4-hydroxy-2-oxoglutarate aldolase